MVGGTRCYGSRSIRHGSCFQQSNLALQEVLYLTYDILRREPAKHIQDEHHFNDHTIAEWGMFCRETLLVYLEGSSEKIGGPNKTVEIDESKFGRRKYHKGHPVYDQWVFGGVERGAGRTFLVPVRDRPVDTLMNVIRAWIETGTTLISDSWAAYRDIESQGYTHRTVNHIISFVNPDTRDHTNTIDCTWRHVNAFLGPYYRSEHYEIHLAHYMFIFYLSRWLTFATM
jgi:transposase-like protein